MKNALSVIIILALAGLALFGYFNYLSPASTEEPGFKAPMVKKEQMKDMDDEMDMEEGEEELMDGEDEAMSEEEMAEIEEMEAVAEEVSAVYADYATGVADGKKHVLFFHADWCPSCVKADSDLKAELEDMPANTMIYKVNFDKEVELKKEYGVTGQHTAVMINADGSVAGVKQGFTLDEVAEFFAS